MTVNELLTKLSSYELSQWMAFERVNGPLGRQYGDDMAANIHEQLQAIQFILGRMSAGADSPVPAPHRVLRPHEVLSKHTVESYETEDTEEMDLELFSSIMEINGRTLPGT